MKFALYGHYDSRGCAALVSVEDTEITPDLRSDDGLPKSHHRYLSEMFGYIFSIGQTMDPIMDALRIIHEDFMGVIEVATPDDFNPRSGSRELLIGYGVPADEPKLWVKPGSDWVPGASVIDSIDDCDAVGLFTYPSKEALMGCEWAISVECPGSGWYSPEFLGEDAAGAILLP